MKRLFVLTLVVVAVGFFGVIGYWQTAAGQAMAPPGGEYKKVSSLVNLPDFLPGLGTLYVVPSTLPAGPFLAYDRGGKLVSSVYMIPIKDIDAHKKFDNLNVAKEKVEDVQLRRRADDLAKQLGYVVVETGRSVGEEGDKLVAQIKQLETQLAAEGSAAPGESGAPGA